MKNHTRKGLNRRQFLGRCAGLAGTAALGPMILPSTRVRAGYVPPSERIHVGIIGYGWMGSGNTGNLLNRDGVRVVAVCDVDGEHLEKARNAVNEKYGDEACVTYGDHRDILAHPDLDAVCVSLPDHWHSVVAIDAARAGKDIYGEKPLSHTLAEGRAMCDAVQKYGVVWQTGSWQRSVGNFRQACNIVRNGRIGKILRVEVGLPSGYYGPQDETLKPPPDYLDYERWLGPAPYAQYCQARVHVNWRWHLDYGGGQLMDWVGHHVDIAHWGLGFDRTGPVAVDARGEFPDTGLWNAATTYRGTVTYANGLEMIVAGGDPAIQRGTKWIGTDGWVYVNRGAIDAHPKSLLEERFGPNDVHVYHSDDHMANWLDCIRTRRETITPAEVAHRSASVGHLALISMRLGRKLRFDPQTETILDDEPASRMLGKGMRSPWRL